MFQSSTNHRRFKISCGLFFVRDAEPDKKCEEGKPGDDEPKNHQRLGDKSAARAKQESGNHRSHVSASSDDS